MTSFLTSQAIFLGQSLKNTNMTTVTITCPQCNKQIEKYVGYVNRANKIGAPLYCSKPCSAIARKSNKSVEQKKAEKSDYDKKRRDIEKNDPVLLEKSRKQGRESYYRNIEKYESYRKANMQKHVERLRNPEYRAYKKRYDELYNAKKSFGEFAEAALILEKILAIIPNREIKQHNNLTNKTQKRKRSWLKTKKANLPR